MGKKLHKIQSLNESWGNFQWPSVNVIKIFTERRGKILNNNGQNFLYWMKTMNPDIQKLNKTQAK